MASQDRPLHDPYDDDIEAEIRARRLELGLSVAEAASRSGVSEQTWRNYEAGRTTVRGDKQPGVWDTLEWEIPEFPAGYGPDFLRLLPGLLAQGDMGDMGFADDGGGGDAGQDDLPAWDEIPEALASRYSSLVSRFLGEPAARCLALGSDLLVGALGENLDELSAMPRGAHAGELSDSAVIDCLPRLWLTRYDYEFIFQLRSLCEVLTARLVLGDIGPGVPLARTCAETLAVQAMLQIGCMVADGEGPVAISPEQCGEWVRALCDGELATALVLAPIACGREEFEHFENWFVPLPEPFVPAWPDADDLPRPGSPS